MACWFFGFIWGFGEDKDVDAIGRNLIRYVRPGRIEDDILFFYNHLVTNHQLIR